MYSWFCPHHLYLCDKSWKKNYITAIFPPVHCSIKILLPLSIRNRFHLYPVIVSLFSFAVFLPSLFPCFFSYLLGCLLASFFSSLHFFLFPTTSLCLILPPYFPACSSRSSIRRCTSSYRSIKSRLSNKRTINARKCLLSTSGT